MRPLCHHPSHPFLACFGPGLSLADRVSGFLKTGVPLPCMPLHNHAIQSDSTVQYSTGDWMACEIPASFSARTPVGTW